MSYDINAGDAGKLVDGEMVIGDLSTIGIREPLPIATSMRRCPYLINNVFCKVLRYSLTMETSIFATYHIEQNTETSIVSYYMWHASPILRAEAPGDALGRLIIIGMGTVVLGIEEDDVNTYLCGLCL